MKEKFTFQPDDFTLRGLDESQFVDTNFASHSFWKEAFQRFVSNKGALISLIIIFLIVLLAIIGPHMTPYTYNSQTISEQNLAPRVPGLEKLGVFDGTEKMQTSTGYKEINGYVSGGLDDTYYWFGSDNLGRDIWTRVWTGTRISLYIAVVAVVVDVVFGLSYGLISGYFGGAVDMVMQRFVDVLSCIPNLVIVTLLVIILTPGLGTITLALCIRGWISMSRIARAQVLKLKEQEFVLASRTLGAKSFFIIFREILPNIMGAIITKTMFSIPDAIFTEAFLAFIGLGIPAPLSSLGSLISDSFKLLTTHPYMIASPLIVLELLMLCFNMAGDGLRDALDPKMKSM